MNEQVAPSTRILLWQRLESPGLERFTLEQDPTPTLNGTVVLALEGQPATVHYRIFTTADWKTRQVTVELAWGDVEKRIELHVDDEQRWWQGEQELTQLRGFYDVDLSVTPATNTLPLRRLELGIGEDREVTAAWVKFPELELEPLPQRYTHVAERHYRYESGTELVNFSAELQVDDLSIVTDYIMANDSSGHRAGWVRVPKSVE